MKHFHEYLIISNFAVKSNVHSNYEYDSNSGLTLNMTLIKTSKNMTAQ